MNFCGVFRDLGGVLHMQRLRCYCRYKLIVIDAFLILHYNITWSYFSYNCNITPNNQGNADESNRSLSKSWKTPQKFITKFTTLMYNYSRYMYVYHTTYYNCRKYPENTIKQWRALHYYELICFLYTILFISLWSKTAESSHKSHYFDKRSIAACIHLI